MLALTRRIGEEIVLGDPAKPLGVIRVVEIHGDKVRLSFDFPREMQINRKELADQKRKQLEAGNGGQNAPGSQPGSPVSPSASPRPNGGEPPPT